MNRPAVVPTISGERLVLRPFAESDVVALVDLLADRSIADATLHIPYPYAESDARAWIGGHAAACVAGAALHWAVVQKVSPGLVGAVALSLIEAHEQGDLGYWIGVPYQGKGFASEAARTVVAHAFDVLDLHRVTAHHMAWNAASGRVLEHAGMRREGLLREHIRKNGRFVDAALYGVLRSEFRKTSPPPR